MIGALRSPVSDKSPSSGQAWITLLPPGLTGTVAGLFLAVSASGRWHRVVLYVPLGAALALVLQGIASRLFVRRTGLTQAIFRRQSAPAWLVGGFILAAYLPAYLFAPSHPALAPWVRWHVLIVAALAVVALHIAVFTRREERQLSDRQGHILLAALIVAYVAICMVLSAYRWRIFTLGNHDSAIVIQSLRYTLDERRLLFNTIEKASHLAVHNSPIYLLLLPLYAPLRRPDLFLIALPPLAIGLSVLPFYCLARPQVGIAAALLLAAAYLLYPSLMARSVGDFYEMTLLPCLWLPTFYYYERKKAFLSFFSFASAWP